MEYSVVFIIWQAVVTVLCVMFAVRSVKFANQIDALFTAIFNAAKDIDDLRNYITEVRQEIKGQLDEINDKYDAAEEMSMEAFEEELLELCPGLDIDARVSEEDMYYLNPHSVQNPKVGAKDLHWKSPNAPWREEFNECLRQNVDWRSFGSRIFSDMDRACEICKVENFELDLYFICIHLEGLPIESPGFFDFFTSDELENLAEFGENYILYVRTGRYPKADGRGWALAESLLEDFIVKADRDMREGEPAVRLRFGHDGCMMSLFALMELDGWNGSESDPTRFREVWDISKVRMAANIQFIFYRNAEGRTIVRMLYNEEDTKLPFPAIEGEEYFYDWEDFKAFYSPRIEAAKKLLEESSI